MSQLEDLRLEFAAWWKQHYPAGDDSRRQMCWEAFREGNAIGFNQGASAASQMEGGR